MKFILGVIRVVLSLALGYLAARAVTGFLGVQVAPGVLVILAVGFSIGLKIVWGMIKAIFWLVVVVAIVVIVIYWLYISGYLEQIIPMLPILPQILKYLQ